MKALMTIARKDMRPVRTKPVLKDVTGVVMPRDGEAPTGNDREGCPPAGSGSTRRVWLTQQLGAVALLATRTGRPAAPQTNSATQRAQADRLARQAVPLDPASWEALARRGVEAATAAGARYAEARLTRRVIHQYGCGTPGIQLDVELTGVSVRALVDGYWGFSASAVLTPEEVVRLAQDAVGQARENAKGPPWTVDLGHYAPAVGRWATPVAIDPFTISIEEKEDTIRYWKNAIYDAGLVHFQDGTNDTLDFVREERVVATSDGACFTQTCFQTHGSLTIMLPSDGGLGGLLGAGGSAKQLVHGLDWTGAGWELFAEAKILEQLDGGQIQHELEAMEAISYKPAVLGKYTLVCDGATMALLTEVGLGIATQLDRALGYEANAGGTSWIDDPLGMVGQASIASPVVTVTANRSAPRALATVKWDEEGVIPDDFTLVKDGVLVDFQTTREQAAWLAPYYQRSGRPVRSHGCAGVESAHVIPMQHMPNLSLEPHSAALRMEDLVADVADGILLDHAWIEEMDAQGRTGLLYGTMREIRNGRVGRGLANGAILLDTKSLWRDIKAVGGPATQGAFNRSNTFHLNNTGWDQLQDYIQRWLMKGQPPQATGHTVSAVAATIANQPLINPARRG